MDWSNLDLGDYEEDTSEEVEDDNYYEQDTKISIEKDSVATIMRKLKQRAYRGNAPEGGDDFSPVYIVKQCEERHADYVVDIDPVEENPVISYDANDCVPVLRGEPVPSRSDPPFKGTFSDSTPVGSFGKALHSHMELVALCESYGADTKFFDGVFRRMWGIPLDEDLSAFKVSVRSTGYEAFGGIRRRDVPNISALTGAQARVHVSECRLNKDRLDPRVLIDWPRLKATVKALVTAVVQDDVVGHDKATRMYYKVLTEELPLAPRAIASIPCPDFVQDPVISEQTVTQMARFREALQKSQQFNEQPSANFAIEDDTPAPYIVSAQQAKAAVADVGRSAFDNFLDNNTYENLVAHRSTFENRELIRKTCRDPSTLVTSWALWYALARGGRLERPRIYKGLAAEVDTGDPTRTAQAQLDLARCFSDSFLEQVSMIGNIVNKGKGLAWLKEMMRYLGIDTVSYSSQGLAEKMRQIRETHRANKIFYEALEAAACRSAYIRFKCPAMNSRIATLLTTGGGFIQGISEMIRRHSFFWIKRVCTRVASSREERVFRSILAQCLRKVRLKMSREKGISPCVQRTVQTYYEIADRRLRKVSGKRQSSIQVLWYSDPKETIQKIDSDMVKALKRYNRDTDYVSFYSNHDRIWSEMEKFANDFSSLMDRLYACEESEVPEDWYDENDAVPSMSISRNYRHVSDPPLVEEKKEIAAVEEPTESEQVDDEDMFGDGEDLMNCAKTTVSLRDAVEEECFDMEADNVRDWLSEQPDEVPWDKVTEYIAELKAVVARR